MAPRRVSQSDDDPPRLRLSTATIRQRLEGQVAAGRSLLERAVGDEKELEQLRLDASQWSDVNVQVLRQGFTGETVVPDYHSAHGPTHKLPRHFAVEVGDETQRITRQIGKLESLIGTLDLFAAPGAPTATPGFAPALEKPAPDADRRVMIVHGRNLRAQRALTKFLSALDLKPIDWSEAVKATGKAAPYIGEVLDAAFSMAQAVVVLLTPDDEARLNRGLWGKAEPEYERELTGQARPNVLFEAGMALSRHPERTLLLEVGELRPFSDLAGRHVLRWDNTVKRREDLADRLATAGCRVDKSTGGWRTTENLAPTVGTLGVRSRPQATVDEGAAHSEVSKPVGATEKAAEWLAHIASQNLNHADKYVARWRPPVNATFELQPPSPYVDFDFSFDNASIFELVVEPGVQGHIRFNDKPALPSPTIEVAHTGIDVLVLQPQSSWRLRLRQLLQDGMARYIADELIPAALSASDKDGSSPRIPVDFTGLEVGLIVRKGFADRRFRLPMGNLAIEVPRPPSSAAAERCAELDEHVKEGTAIARALQGMGGPPAPDRIWWQVMTQAFLDAHCPAKSVAFSTALIPHRPPHDPPSGKAGKDLLVVTRQLEVLEEARGLICG